MNKGHWQYHEDFDINDWFGFIYRITEISTGKQYLGKKQFFKYARKKIKGNKNRKRIVTESDWKTYTSSSPSLNADIQQKGIQNFLFEILSLHNTKGGLGYAEMEIQFKEDVLRALLPNGEKKYHNRTIGHAKFLAPETLDAKARKKISKKLKGRKNPWVKKRRRKGIPNFKNRGPNPNKSVAQKAAYARGTKVSARKGKPA